MRKSLEDFIKAHAGHRVDLTETRTTSTEGYVGEDGMIETGVPEFVADDESTWNLACVTCGVDITYSTPVKVLDALLER